MLTAPHPQTSCTSKITTALCPPGAAMWTLLTHSTSLPLCSTGTAMSFSYSLKPPGQPDVGCYWKKKISVSNTQIFTPSGSAESDRNARSSLTCALIQQCGATWMKGQQIIHPGRNTLFLYCLPQMSSENIKKKTSKTQVRDHFHTN